jgi:hypothetical protein
MQQKRRVYYMLKSSKVFFFCKKEDLQNLTNIWLDLLQMAKVCNFVDVLANKKIP